MEAHLSTHSTFSWCIRRGVLPFVLYVRHLTTCVAECVFRAASKVLYDPVHDARKQQIAVHRGAFDTDSTKCSEMAKTIVRSPAPNQKRIGEIASVKI